MDRTCKGCGREFKGRNSEFFCKNCKYVKTNICRTPNGSEIQTKNLPYCIKSTYHLECTNTKCTAKKQCGFYTEGKFTE